MLAQDDIFHTMKIVDILGKHHAKQEAVLDLTKTASLQLSSLPSPFLNLGKFLWKMSTITIQLTKTITYENIADIKEIWSKNVYHLIRDWTMQWKLYISRKFHNIILVLIVIKIFKIDGRCHKSHAFDAYIHLGPVSIWRLSFQVWGFPC